MKIIVLSITAYKEKDGIIEALSEQGVISFTIKGFYDPKNKFTALNNVVTIADVELSDSRYKYPLLKNYSIIQSPMKENSDLTYMGALMYLSDLTRKLVQDEEKEMIFKHLYAALISLKGAQEPWMILLIYMANICKATGYDFDVSGCVFCGKKKGIATFSFEDGGFVCQDCLEQERYEKPFNNEQMLLLRAAFMAGDYAHTHEYCSKENALTILNRFNIFFMENYGVSISALALLN